MTEIPMKCLLYIKKIQQILQKPNYHFHSVILVEPCLVFTVSTNITYVDT